MQYVNIKYFPKDATHTEQRLFKCKYKPPVLPVRNTRGMFAYSKRYF